jgi:hypothetical protein
MALHTDVPNWQGTAFMDLADVLAIAGRSQEGEEALHRAIEAFGRKGNVVLADRARAVLRASPASGSPGMTPTCRLPDSLGFVTRLCLAGREKAARRIQTCEEPWQN